MYDDLIITKLSQSSCSTFLHTNTLYNAVDILRKFQIPFDCDQVFIWTRGRLRRLRMIIIVHEYHSRVEVIRRRCLKTSETDFKTSDRLIIVRFRITCIILRLCNFDCDNSYKGIKHYKLLLYVLRNLL